MEFPTEVEVLVAGGGPAGAATARRLAQLGHEVLLVEQHAAPTRHIGESLPAGILPLLEQLGVKEAVERAGFLRPAQARVQWSPQADRFHSDSAPRGFQVDRMRFDSILRDAAQEAGVRILTGVRVVSPHRAGARRWQVPLQCADGSTAIRARFLVDAGGRRALLPGKKRRLTPPTLALYGYWRDAPIQGEEARVEAGANAWYWGAPLPDGTVNACVFVDPQRMTTAGQPPAKFYRCLLAESDLLRACLHGTLDSPVVACTASAYFDEACVGEDYVKVGEACLRLDPLSSQGVTMALQSGLQGAIVAHTLLVDPDAKRDAIAFYQSRQRATAERHALLAARFYAEHEAYRALPFWQIRSAAAVQTTFDRPIARQDLPAPTRLLRLSDPTRIEDRPCLVEDRIVMCKVLVHPSLDGPVAYIGGIQVAELLEQMGPEANIARLVKTITTSVSVDRAIQIVKWLFERGILCPASKERKGYSL